MMAICYRFDRTWISRFERGVELCDILGHRKICVEFAHSQPVDLMLRHLFVYRSEGFSASWRWTAYTPIARMWSRRVDQRRWVERGASIGGIIGSRRRLEILYPHDIQWGRLEKNTGFRTSATWLVGCLVPRLPVPMRSLSPLSKSLENFQVIQGFKFNKAR